jgi:hypothetical protein
VTYSRDTTRWSTIALSKALPGDAVVKYSETGTKHIVLIGSVPTSGGRFSTYECAGCASGCLTKSMTVVSGDGWRVIRRTGW